MRVETPAGGWIRVQVHWPVSCSRGVSGINAVVFGETAIMEVVVDGGTRRRKRSGDGHCRVRWFILVLWSEFICSLAQNGRFWFWRGVFERSRCRRWLNDELPGRKPFFNTLCDPLKLDPILLPIRVPSNVHYTRCCSPRIPFLVVVINLVPSIPNKDGME